MTSPIERATEDVQVPLLSVPFEIDAVDESAADAHGEVFTKRWVVEMILDLVGYTSDQDLVRMIVIEPSCGSGAFLVPMIERLMDSAERHGHDLADAAKAVRAWDLLSRNVAEAKSAVVATLVAHKVSEDLSHELSEAWVNQADFLLEPPEPESADFVVGNPPYIRLEAVASRRSEAYRQSCTTMGGRSDIYVGFYEKALKALRRGGMLGFICADRWMRNAYGARLRQLISGGWSVETIVHMTGVDAFDNDVDAYPAVTVIRRGEQSVGPLVADAQSMFGPACADQLVAIAAQNQPSDTAPFEATGDSARFRAARMPTWFSGTSGWPNASPERLRLIADLESRLPALEDQVTGTRVGIGVATGADKVFITSETQRVEESRLLPLAMSRDISSGAVEWSGKYLINPWDETGLVDLNDWPGLREYLTPHEEKLRARHTARSGKWHKTIDRVIEGLATGPKLYVPDFKDVLFPVLDSGDTYPHHNLYWISSERWNLEVLGGLLLSDVANLFIEAYSVRMRGGYLRFQAQYLRRIRLPHIDEVRQPSADALATAFRDRDRDRATEVALDLYGIGLLPD